jgi:hypothetical protein
MNKKILLIVLCFLITGCVAKEMDFDVFDNKAKKECESK